MLIKGSFSENCLLYENFEVWDIESMDKFFEGNSIINTIFEDHYKFPVSEFNEKRSEIEANNKDIMELMLEYVGDKHFYVFTLHDPHHLDLIQMQNSKIMNFGVDIEAIQPDHFYVLIADKKTNP